MNMFVFNGFNFSFCLGVHKVTGLAENVVRTPGTCCSNTQNMFEHTRNMCEEVVVVAERRRHAVRTEYVLAAAVRAK